MAVIAAPQCRFVGRRRNSPAASPPLDAPRNVLEKRQWGETLESNQWSPVGTQFCMTGPIDGR